jgi:multimeric flavodoxin WrbA
MSAQHTRRTFFGAAGAVPIALAQGPEAIGAGQSKTVKIIGVSCSPRKDRTTAAALRVCLEAAKAAGPEVEVELIDLGGMKINGDLAAGERDDFPQFEAKLRAPNVGGIIVGTPVYFSGMSSLCKAFLDRWMAFRGTFALRNKVGGAVAVGAARNGGQELTLQAIHAAMLCQDMIIVSEGSKDEVGLATARSLGGRVAELALLLRKAGT